MTEKELKKLRRADLLEMLLTLTQENEDLRGQLEQAKQKLESRTIAIESAGSLAEAALQLNGIFEAAQAACDQYTENIRHRSENIDQICSQMEQQTREKCAQLEQETQEKCDRLLSEARLQAELRWEETLREDAPLSDIEEEWLIHTPADHTQDGYV